MKFRSGSTLVYKNGIRLITVLLVYLLGHHAVLNGALYLGPDKQMFEHKVVNFFSSIIFNMSNGCSKNMS